MKTRCTLLLVVVSIAGCAAPAEQAKWVMVGGSKADGAVTLGIDVPAKWGYSETPVHWDINQANAEADRRCKNWGYVAADMYREGQFPILKTCYAQGVSPCWSKTYRIRYQCVGKD